MHVRNLQAAGVKQVTLDVDFVCKAMEGVSPLPSSLKKKKEDTIIIGDGGGFDEE